MPDEASFSTATHACGGIAALNQGTLIHNLIMKSGFERNMSIASSLITMYSKGSSLMEAHRVFQQIDDPNVVCWGAMISAFQQHGHSNQVIELLENMPHQGIRPHYITFVCLLSACAHTGRVGGFAHFDSITAVHKIEIGPEHYATMVDMLGRAGQLEEAIRFIASMPQLNLVLLSGEHYSVPAGSMGILKWLEKQLKSFSRLSLLTRKLYDTR